MLFSSWLRNRKRAARRAPCPSPLAPHRRASFRPRLEILEDRTLLSTYVVNSLTDTGTGSGLAGDLRYCITNATSGNDMITFAANLTGTIKLESALPALNASVVIQGPGATALTVVRDSANTPTFGIFAVGSSATVEISGLTLSGAIDSAIANAGTLTVSACVFSGNVDANGRGALANSGTATVSNCAFNDNVSSGAINNSGTATVSNCTFDGNSSTDGGGVIFNLGALTLNYSTIEASYATYFGSARGGAIYNAGALTVNNSTLTNNEVQGGRGGSSSGDQLTVGNGLGGGIYMEGGTLSINSSTLSDNRAVGGDVTSAYPGVGNGYGGGLYIASGTVSINNSTFADNQAIGGIPPLGYASNAYGGGIDNAAGSSALQMHDTLLADNSTTIPYGDISANTAGPDLDGSFSSLGHNLIGNSTGGSGFAASDLLNVNPLLGPLQNNGGPTQTMALLPGSRAIDAGDNTNAPTYDQRGPGYPRIFNGTIDIGAFEVQTSSPAQVSSLAVAGFPSVITAGSPGSFTVTVQFADGSTDTSYTGTVHFTSSDPQAVLPADYTFTSADAGVHSFSAVLKTSSVLHDYGGGYVFGTQSITVQDTATTIGGSQSGIVVNPAAASSFIVHGYSSPITAGMASSFVVTAIDPYGNMATTYTGTVHITSSDAKAVLPSNFTISGGTATFSATLKTAGTQSITATDTTTASITGSEAGITVNPAAASKFIITAPSTVNAGVAFNLTLTVLDAYGNVVTGYIGTVNFSSSDTKASLPKNYAFTAADEGVHTFAGLILRKRGNQKITITDAHDSSLIGSIVVDVL